MSINTATLEEGTNTSVISINKLIALYAVIPIAWLIYAADQYTFGLIHLSLPKRPEDWVFWIYIFGLPHVFASYFLIADKEYAAHFGHKLWIGALVILAGPYLASKMFGDWLVIVVFTSMIVYHTVAQQFGIALVIAKRKPDLLHQINTACGSMLGVVIYLFLYADTAQTMYYYTNTYKSELMMVALAMLGVVLAITTFQIATTQNTRGRIYMGLNALMLVSMLILYKNHLGLVVVIMGRIIHEFTAWLIYASHDKNRNQKEMKNLVYRHFSWLKISPYGIGIVLAFAFGTLFTYAHNATDKVLYLLVISSSLYHYWLEGFIWKGQSLPKQHLKFV